VTEHNEHQCTNCGHIGLLVVGRGWVTCPRCKDTGLWSGEEAMRSSVVGAYSAGTSEWWCERYNATATAVLQQNDGPGETLSWLKR